MLKKIWLPLLAAAALLALALLVPSSPVLEVDNPTVLWASSTDAWGDPSGLVVTAYGVMIALGGALAIGLTMAVCRQQNKGMNSLALALVSGLIALAGSHWLFCALRWSYILNDLEQTPLALLQFWKGGYTMYGAILGGLLGAFVYARMTRRSPLSAMDAIMPGMTILLVIGRAAECFTSQGMGTYAVNEALRMLPFVTANEWGDAQLPVYIYEAIAAGAAFVTVAVMLKRNKAPAGRAAENGLIIISAAQILLDSWRGDELIRFGFVRLNMLAAGITLLVLMILRMRRAIQADGRVRPWTWLRLTLLLAGAAMVILIEFALDKSAIDNTLLYAVMAAMVLLMGCAMLIDGKQAHPEK